jgi:uncharacterized membrane protein YeaQ/YmgE (transglycosylase-associated protein family)
VAMNGHVDADGFHGAQRLEVAAMEITGIFSALIVGLVIGVLGRLIVPGPQRIPVWLTIVVGIVAALVGTFIARALGVADTKGVDWIQLLVQIALAALGVGITAGMYGRRTLT